MVVMVVVVGGLFRDVKVICDENVSLYVLQVFDRIIQLSD